MLPGSETLPEGQDSTHSQSLCWILHIPAGPQPIQSSPGSCPGGATACWEHTGSRGLNFRIKPCALTSHHPVPQGPQQAAEGVQTPGTPSSASAAFTSNGFKEILRFQQTFSSSVEPLQPGMLHTDIYTRFLECM